MKRMTTWRDMFILLIIFVFEGAINAQKIIPGPEDLYQEAVEYIAAGEYSEALPVLLNLRERGFSGANISFKIGECYLNTNGQKTKAIPFLKEASQKISDSCSGDSLDEGTAPLKTLLYLGISYRLKYDFDNAVNCFTRYLQLLETRDTLNRSLVRYHIDRCSNAQELIASPAKFKCDTLPVIINTSFSNFNPVITGDEKQIYYMDQLKCYDAVMHSYKEDTLWQKPENITAGIRSDGDHLLTGISPDGTELLLTVYDPYLSGEIFISRYKDGKWDKMARLNSNINTRFNETHASFSPDGRFLYFTSDRKGGFGGLDIYRSGRDEKGDWDVAENLGPLINTPYNEETPFIAGDTKCLFFSSQGHYNMGGYDIFMSAPDSVGNWLPPINLGYPINTTDDDLFYFPVGTGRIAYQSRFSEYPSHRHIMRYNISSFGNPARYKILGNVNLQSDTGYENGNISVLFSDNKTNESISVTKLNKEGSFTQKLPSGSFSVDFMEGSSVLAHKDFDIPDYFPQDELILNTSLAVHKANTGDSVLLKNILFEFNQSQLDDPYLKVLDKLAVIMSAHPGMRLSVNGYADSHGNDKYNLKLSLARANSVAAYLKQNNSISGNIDVTAFGEKDPVAINQNPDGTDNPDGRSHNRRVELVLNYVPNGLKISKLNEIPVNLRIR